MAARKKTTARRTSPRRKPVTKPVYIHELNPNGTHRIVSVKDQIAMEGQWVPFDRVAIHGRMRAATEYFQGVLPEGLFTTSSFGAARVNG